MQGTRITAEEEKESYSTYIGVGIAIILAAVAIYFFFVMQREKKQVTGFDPNRPVPSDSILKKRLKPEEYAVVREGFTQTPFQNQYWNNEKVGIYCDVITGEPLFTSLDKFDRGFGMPTFSKPISPDLLVETLDNSRGFDRFEVRAKRSNARLGYRIPEPKSPTGQAYSMNSAAFDFIAADQMKGDGYEAYTSLLEKK